MGRLSRRLGFAIGLAAGIAAAGPAAAGDWDGTLTLGGVMLDEEAGDFSAMQETYNVYDGFSIAQFRLNGRFQERHRLTLDLSDLNLDDRKARLVYRLPGHVKFTAQYDQHRQVFDQDQAITSDRKDWRFGARATVTDWLTLSGNYGHQIREGQRLGFPSGVARSALGDGYDYVLQTGRLESQFRQDSRVLAVAYSFSDFSDQAFEGANRTGQVLSGRLFVPDPFLPRLSHAVRAAYGTHEISQSEVDYTVKNFQYTGTYGPLYGAELRYRFFTNRTDDESTGLITDNIRNDFDATYHHPFGMVTGGYGYEMNDDDGALTSYDVFRAGASFRYRGKVKARVNYANRQKTDKEKLTLLQDLETETISARLEVQPVRELSFGGSFANRTRDLPDIGVQVEGETFTVFGRVGYDGFEKVQGTIGADYTFADDDYDDRIGSYETRSYIFTSRADATVLDDFRFGGGFTWVDIEEDLDTEKAIVFLEGAYTFRENYHLEVKYNAYNFDDFILVNRYYTANVFRINLGYDFDLKS
jgi:hypothetical protein